MSNDWRSRLREVIKRDGRSLRAISAATDGVGENYLQQMLKDEKDPGFSRLARVLAVLGPEATVYIISGTTLDPEQHLRVALVAAGMKDDRDMATVLGVARRLIDRTGAGTQEQNLPHDQSQPSNHPHGSEPSRPKPEPHTS